ncbi:hypothetical protein [Chitinophaga eiseniae]|uniref:Uncharacterized protein n=1 Tax=Chitinophaga eiseniae TaxID=634771 RepID=A0A847SPU7_9BACT|nr:hypothetical protein [Chitinophaga eiseniae]NLR78072.1 hypothetical protein [Chitinophaga eiseniae]
MRKANKNKEGSGSQQGAFRSFSAVLFIVLDGLFRFCKRMNAVDTGSNEGLSTDDDSTKLNTESICVDIGSSEFAKSYKFRVYADRKNEFTGCEILLEFSRLVRQVMIDFHEQGIPVTYSDLYASLFEVVKERRKVGGLKKAFSFFLSY